MSMMTIDKRDSFICSRFYRPGVHQPVCGDVRPSRKLKNPAVIESFSIYQVEWSFSVNFDNVLRSTVRDCRGRCGVVDRCLHNSIGADYRGLSNNELWGEY